MDEKLSQRRSHLGWRSSTDLHHPYDVLMARDGDVRVPHLHKVARALRIFLRVRGLVQEPRDLRDREVVERVLERARDLLRVRAAGLDQVLRDVAQ